MEGRHPKEIERLALLLAGADGSREGCGDKEIEREDCLLLPQCYPLETLTEREDCSLAFLLQ